MIQKRNIAMYIIRSSVTCGIFGIYWFICLTDDSKLAANDNESASGPVAFLLTIVTCGIYSWYWAYKLGDRVDYAANSRGIGDGSSNSKILFIVLQLLGLGIVNYLIAQDKLNKISDYDSFNGNGYNGFNGGYSNNNYNSDNNSFNNYNAASDSSYSGNTDNYSSDSSYADNVFNNANNDSSSYGSSASEEPGNSYTGSVNNAPYGSPFDNDKSDN